MKSGWKVENKTKKNNVTYTTVVISILWCYLEHDDGGLFGFQFMLNFQHMFEVLIGEQGWRLQT